MSGPRGRALLDVARGLFLVAAVGFGWWALRSRWDEVTEALAQVSPGRVVAACVAVLSGLAVTSVIWRALMSAFGHSLDPRRATALFFVGQLGKYIPGSIWSLGAQADMARRDHVPPRTTVTVGLLFLWVHVATAVSVGAVLVEVPDGWPELGPALRVALAAVGLIALAPPVLTRLARVLATEPLRISSRVVVGILLAMAVVWAAYGLGVALVVPPGALTDAGGLGAVLLPWTGAFAVSYVAGVVIILAPAGVGVREGVLIALMAPAVGVPVAAASALLVRVVHTVCDFAIAAIAWLVARGAGPRESSP